MKLVPLGDKIVLKQLEAEETTKSGIVLPGQAKEKPQEAEVESWIRSYSLQKGQLRISDSFRLTTAKQPNQINFMTWGQVNTEIPGKIQLEVKGKKAVIEYDKQLFDVKTEIIPLTDTRLSNVWGKSICRITLTATNIYKTGNYSFTIKKQ